MSRAQLSRWKHWHAEKVWHLLRSGFPRLLLSSQTAQVIKYLACPDTQRSPSTFIIFATLEEAGKLPKVTFCHVSREQNHVAHELVQMAKRLRHSSVWRACAPVCVEQTVAQDVNSSHNP